VLFKVSERSNFYDVNETKNTRTENGEVFCVN